MPLLVFNVLNVFTSHVHKLKQHTNEKTTQPLFSQCLSTKWRKGEGTFFKMLADRRAYLKEDANLR